MARRRWAEFVMPVAPTKNWLLLIPICMPKFRISGCDILNGVVFRFFTIINALYDMIKFNGANFDNHFPRHVAENQNAHFPRQRNVPNALFRGRGASHSVHSK